MWVDLVLEAELISIRPLVTAAILDRVDVRVGNIDPTLFVQRNDLVEAIGARKAHDRQSAAGHAAAETDELEMLQHLFRPETTHAFRQPSPRADHADKGIAGRSPSGRTSAPAARGVVPGVFVKRDLARAVVGRRFLRDRATVAQQRLEALQRGLRDHRDQDALAIRTIRFQRAEIGRQRPGDRRERRCLTMPSATRLHNRTRRHR